MKKLLLVAGLLALALTSHAQVVYSTNITAGAGTYLLTSDRVAAYSFEVSATNAYTLYFYDSPNANSVPGTGEGVWGTNVVNAAYISRSTYATNMAVSFTNYNGYVNWNTNSGLWTVTTTNAAGTNSLPLALSIPISANETRVTYASVLFTRGIVFRTTGNVSLTVYGRQQ